MRKIEYTGSFYLPNRGKKYPGRIISNEENTELILEIFGDESLEGNKLIQNASNEIVYYHQIILGNIVLHKKMTLLECYWDGTYVIGEGLFQIKYKIRTILKGSLIESYNNMKFDSITVCVPYVASWYDGWQSFEKLDKLSEFKKEEIQSLSVNSNLTINLIDHITNRVKTFGKTQEINYQKYIQFSYTTEEHIENIISDIIRFTKLLEFSISKRIRFKLIDAEIKNKYISTTASNSTNPLLNLIQFDNFSFVQKQDVNIHSIHQNIMLFSKWVLSKDKLNALILNWYKKDEFYHIYDFYLDSYNWFEGTDAVLSNVMFNNRFLNLIQALEDYHRKLNDNSIPDKVEFEDTKSEVLKLLNKNSILKKWTNDRLKFKKVPDLKERLSYLVNNSIDIITGIFNDMYYFNDFPDLAKDYRNLLSHGNMKSTYQGEELNRLFLMAQIMLTICILQSLELDNETILRLIKHKSDFKRTVYELNIKKARP